MYPQGENEIRLSKVLDDALAPPDWPDGFLVRTLRDEDVTAVHALLVETLDEPEKADWFWWARRKADPEFSRDLHFVVADSAGLPAAVGFSWTSAFIKDFAVRPSARRAGVGSALLVHVFRAFHARGAARVDLKTNRIGNADAVRLYRRHGMIEVDWAD